VLTISKPLSAAQARAYHAEEFGNARDNYYTTADQIRGQWHGRLARQWGLAGDVRDEQFQRLADGQHPVTGASLVRHHAGDVVRYTKGSHTYGLGAGEYARVVQVNAEDNHVTVRRAHGARVTYDPRRLQGVTLYRETDRAFAAGDRVQLTAPDRAQHLANRELGTIEQLQAKGELRLRLDSGRTVALNLRAYPHLDYGYAVTSHSSQGQTADRCSCTSTWSERENRS
jgi:hypothetical protein